MINLGLIKAVVFASAFVGLSFAGLQLGGILHVYQAGNNPDVGTSYEDVWIGGGTYSWITTTAGITIQVSSASTADDLGSTGATTVTVEGLDNNFDRVSETFTLDGRTAVTGSETFYRVHRAYVTAAGSGDVNAGAIYVSDGGAALTNGVPDVVAARRAVIGADDGETQQAIYTIPDGYRGSLLDLHIGGDDDGKATTFQLMQRPENGAWRVVWEGVSNGEPFEESFYVPIIFAEHTDIRFRAKSSVGSQTGQAHFALSIK